jgi:hypothetical protein
MMRFMKAGFIHFCGATVLWFLPVVFGAETDDRGPLRAINEHPLEIPLISWHLQDTRPISLHKWKWTANLAYSNIYKNDGFGQSQLIIDDEPLRFDLAISYGFARRWDAEVQVGAFRYSGGFMDEFIRKFEGAFGFPTRGQQGGINDQFQFLLIWKGRTFMDRRGSLSGFGDTRILIRRSLGMHGGWSFGAVAALKLPTGKKGLGSGGSDAGFGITSKYARGRWRFRSELDALFSSDLLGIPTRNRADLKLGVEFVCPKISFLMQTDIRGHAITWGKSTLEDSPRQVSVGIGFSKPAGIAHQIYITEDLSRVSPDVTFGYTLVWGK